MRDGDPATPARHVVVVGGGIAGLAAAWFLRRDGGPGLRVTVLEAATEVGGKLRVSEVAGVPVDEGAESLLLRRPEAVGLAAAVGLDDIEPAATTSAAIWSRGVMRPIPTGTVMGVPTDLRAVARSGLLSTRELVRIPADAWLPGSRLRDDVAVGRHVTQRVGRAVVERLVEPLLGGVYAGRADLLSLDATLPQLAEGARHHRSLLAAAKEARAAAAATTTGPVFGAPRGGVGRLPELVARASGATVRTATIVREIARTPTGWLLTVGSARDAEQLTADAIVLAVPPAPAARLLRDHVPAAATELSVIRAASMAIVTLAFVPTAFPQPVQGSGFLVPPVDGRVVKAATFSSSKWAWYADAAPATVVVRLSIGRLDEEADLQRDDADLVEVALGNLTDAIGVTAPPIDVRVTRWGGALPQYAVGHRARVARVRAAVAAQPGLAVCGATYDGVGIPACVASAEQAAGEVLRQWAGDDV